jgi:hypothetical protein
LFPSFGGQASSNDAGSAVENDAVGQDAIEQAVDKAAVSDAVGGSVRLGET